MGYTHYWEFNKKGNEGSYQKALKCCVELANTSELLGDAFGDKGTRPVLDDYGLRFNGLEENSHETFALPASLKKTDNEKDNYWAFCKTAYKPYDQHVTACLVICKYFLGDGIKLSSDGDLKDWEVGIHTAIGWLVKQGFIQFCDRETMVGKMTGIVNKDFGGTGK